LAVYEKNQNWREEVLAIEVKFHFWLVNFLADFGRFVLNPQNPPNFLHLRKLMKGFYS